MFASKCLVTISCVLVIYVTMGDCKCGVSELMKYGKAMQAMASSHCDGGKKPTAQETAKAKQCAQAEAKKAHADYKKYVDMAMSKCMTDKMWNDPCNQNNVAEGKKCAEQMMKDNPNMKSEAMKWVTPHCDKFVNHMKDFASCNGTPLKA